MEYDSNPDLHFVNTGLPNEHTESSAGVGHKTTKSRLEKQTAPSSPKGDKVLEKAEELQREISHKNDDVSMEVGVAEELMRVDSNKVRIHPLSVSRDLTSPIATYGCAFNLSGWTSR